MEVKAGRPAGVGVASGEAECRSQQAASPGQAPQRRQQGFFTSWSREGGWGP